MSKESLAGVGNKRTFKVSAKFIMLTKNEFYDASKQFKFVQQNLL